VDWSFSVISITHFTPDALRMPVELRGRPETTVHGDEAFSTPTISSGAICWSMLMSKSEREWCNRRFAISMKWLRLDGVISQDGGTDCRQP
jgi:hypothetical protein